MVRVVGDVFCRDGGGSDTIGGIWLHRQQADDTSSADDDCAVTSEDDDLETVTTTTIAAVPRLESGCQLIDRADITSFATLLTVTAESELPSRSNVELLSMLTVDDVPSDADSPPQCDGTGCGSLEDAEHCWRGDQIDGLPTTDMDDTVVADNSISESLRQSGAVIESGSGDLTMSPVHHTAAAACTVRTASIPNMVATSRLSVQPPRKTDVCRVSSNEETRYIVEAAELISQAQEHEIGESYHAAYSHYRSGIEILVKGVQSRHTLFSNQVCE